MYRLTRETLAIDQATWVRLIGGIVFDDLALQDAEEDFVKGQSIRLCFFVGMVGDAYAVFAQSVNDVLGVHCETFVLILPDDKGGE